MELGPEDVSLLERWPHFRGLAIAVTKNDVPCPTLASQTKSTPIVPVAGESEISMVGSCSSIVTNTRLSSLCTNEETYTPLKKRKKNLNIHLKLFPELTV